MARLHEIGIAADTKAFDQGIRDGVIEPLEDAEKALEQLGDAADDAGTDGARAVDKLEDALKDAQRQSKRTEDAMDDVGDKSKRAFEKAEDGVKGFKEEAAQSARETAASFDGSFESIADLGQEVAANAFADFGPLGAAAGVAVAGAAGVMIDSFTKVQEAADEAREAAFSMAYDVAGALDAAGYQSRIAQWTEDTEKYKQVKDLATASGWEEVEVLDALASGGDKLDKLTQAYGEHGGETMLTMGRLWELEAALKATDEGYISGADAAKIAARALADYTAQVGTATGETDDLGNAIYSLPDGTTVVVNADTGEAYENVDQFEQKVNGVDGTTVTTTATFDGAAATEEVNRWISQNNGRTFKLRGNVEVSSGVPFE